MKNGILEVLQYVMHYNETGEKKIPVLVHIMKSHTTSTFFATQSVSVNDFLVVCFHIFANLNKNLQILAQDSVQIKRKQPILFLMHYS